MSSVLSIVGHDGVSRTPFVVSFDKVTHAMARKSTRRTSVGCGMV